MEILNSATKLVLIMLAVSLIGLTYSGHVEGKDFFSAVMVVFAFYFGQKTNAPVPTVSNQVEDKG